MSVDICLSALEEYFSAKKDFLAGCGDEESVLRAKKHFSKALNSYIDWRADGVLEERRKRITTEKSFNIADLITMSAAESQEAVTFAVTALNAAPNPPPINLDSWMDAGNHKAWFAAYRRWYEGIRREGMNPPK